ncbi:MAG: YesL family protein [Oscillospiraceae bacterium]|nr:YesL family protein [Oscillospiraceae bacterium]
MNKLFDLNSPFMRALSRMTDLVILSFLWFVCCLPVVTIGPASAALCFVAMKLAKKEEIRVIPTFFQSFKVNFKQGIVLNLIFLAVGAILALDMIYFGAAELGTGTGMTLIRAVFMAMGVWALCIMFYAYPMQAQFYNPIRRTLRNAAILSMQKPVNTVIVFLLNMVPALFVYVSVRYFKSLVLFVRLAPLWVLLAPGVLAYLCGKRFVKLFDPYLNPEKEEETEEEETEE